MAESDERTDGATSSRPSQRPGGAASLVGSVIGGRYRVESLLGEGGMGAVYRAEHTHMHKRFAVKVLHPEMSRLSEVVARFEREALAAAHIEHPNVAAASDFGKLDDGSFFLVLEYVEGKSLRDAIAQGPLDLGRVLRILRQIAAGLQRAHAMGIVHRDLKPENVMLVERESEPDFVKVLDFGIAKVPVGELATDRSKPGTALTQMGMVYGTPEYMAPEQALGQAVDPRADLYALGVMTYEMIAGVRPFDHSSKVTLLGMHVTAAVPPFEDKVPGLVVPAEVDAIVRRMLEKEADKRFPGAKELMDAIDAIWDGAYGVAPGARSSRGSLAGLPALPSIAGSAPARDVPLPGAPRTVTGRQPPPSLAVRAEKFAAAVRENPRPFAIGGAAALASVVLLALLARGGGHEKKVDDTLATASVSASATEPPPRPSTSESPVPPDVEAQIAEAVQAIERGDYGTGIAKLAEYEKLYASRPDVHRALEKAYTATRNVKDALRETELLLATDPRAASDLKIAENVRNAAIGRDASDAAFALLESRMGVMGPDILYDIAYGASGAQYPQAASRAQRSLQKADVKKQATPGLLVTMELRAASSCEAKRALFPRAKDVGDSRTLTVLKSYVATRGCGFANARDCWPCMRREGALAKTIQGLEERLH